MDITRDCLIPYDLCNDKVTVYSPDGASFTRTVHERAYIDFRKNQNVERSGASETNGFLLVIPGEDVACKVGDKVYVGEGPNVPQEDAAAWWRTFIPSKVEGLVVVKHVDPKRHGGKVVHTEAGG